jgi:hypothetical protein
MKIISQSFAAGRKKRRIPNQTSLAVTVICWPSAVHSDMIIPKFQETLIYEGVCVVMYNLSQVSPSGCKFVTIGRKLSCSDGLHP